MIEFHTSHGHLYYYSSSSNRIYPESFTKCVEYKRTEYQLSEKYSLDRISTFTIEVTQSCNLRCKYCCYSGSYDNRRSHQSIELSDVDVQRCIEFIGKYMDTKSPYITVCFYGGEALLAKQKIEHIIALLQMRYSGISFVFSISTNGLLLNESVINWICSIPNLEAVITIDGDRVMHDKNRITSSGQGSFDIIMKNLQFFKNKYPELYLKKVHFISTVKSISDVLLLNSFWMNNELLKNSRPKHVSSIIPNFSQGDKISLDAAPFELFFQTAFDAFINNEENILTDELHRFISIVKYRAYYDLPLKQRFITCLHEPYSCFITATGELYICERMCQEHFIGSLSTGIIRGRCEELNKAFADRKNKYCSRCWAKRLCRICATNLNNNEEHFIQYCDSERIQLKLALQYYCEVLEYEKSHNNGMLP